MNGATRTACINLLDYARTNQYTFDKWVEEKKKVLDLFEGMQKDFAALYLDGMQVTLYT
jgi:hypothetical protein